MLKRFFLLATIQLVVWSITMAIFLPGNQAVAQYSGICGATNKYPSACEKYLATSDLEVGQPSELNFAVYLLPNESEAREVMEAYGEATDDALFAGETDYQFGDGHLAFWYADDAEGEAWGRVAFRYDNLVGSWGFNGDDLEDPAKILFDLYIALDLESQTPATIEEQIYALIPDTDILPSNYELDAMKNWIPEEIAGLPPLLPQEPTAEDLQATIESLERQLEEANAEPTATTRTSNTSRGSSSSRSLEIGQISGKDAGIGDGTIYVYVEVTNNSSRLYSYVGLEGTCYSASGNVLGTGMGNTANVAPGETVIVTMIFLSVPGCDNVTVRFDALTGLV